MRQRLILELNNALLRLAYGIVRASCAVQCTKKTFVFLWLSWLPTEIPYLSVCMIRLEINRVDRFVLQLYIYESIYWLQNRCEVLSIYLTMCSVWVCAISRYGVCSLGLMGNTIFRCLYYSYNLLLSDSTTLANFDGFNATLIYIIYTCTERPEVTHPQLHPSIYTGI